MIKDNFDKKKSNKPYLAKKIILTSWSPLLTILAAVLLKFIYQIYYNKFPDKHSQETWHLVIKFFCWASIALGSYWLIKRLLNTLKIHLLSTSFLTKHQKISILLPFLFTILKTVTLLLLLNAVLPHLGLPDDLSYMLEKLTAALIIGAIAWLLFKLTNLTEKLIYHFYNFKTAGDLNVRKVHTQVLIIKRVVITLIVIVSLGASLMLFDNVRALGASVLTTAGLIGLVLTFTAQRSLGSIFSGLEIAMTQPIKIGDAIVIEKEFGYVEEINFRNVIVKLWDWRRLIVPTSYFLENAFQNWSREQDNNLIGTVYLYVDYKLPVDELRKELKKILQEIPLWDGNVNTIQVSDFKEAMMELRVLVSARTPGDTWNLRCEIREKLINYIAQNFPNYFPQNRVNYFPAIT